MEARDVSVVIPTLDAGPGFGRLLDRLAKAGPAEILVVDSGSRDETVAVARRANARVHEIPPADFGHGCTRNLGASLVDTPLVAFLSQDALPRDADYLADLSKPFADPRVAASRARIVAPPDAAAAQLRRAARDPSDSARAADHRIDDLAAFERRAPSEKRAHCAFDNVASCVRRELLLHFPFPDIEFGEDIAWSQALLRAGWTIAFRPAARVAHAHVPTFEQARSRARLDATLQRACFGERSGSLRILTTGLAECVRDVRVGTSPWRAAERAVAETAGRLEAMASPGASPGASGLEREPPAPPHDPARPLFDTTFYLSQTPAGWSDALDPYTHFVEFGDAQGLWPHPLIDPEHLRRQLPGVERTGGACLRAFAQSRFADGLSPHPLLDTAYLLETHPALHEVESDPLRWYVSEGEAQGVRPHESFDPRWYREQHRDLAALPNVLHHFVHHGMAEGRAPSPGFDTALTLHPNGASPAAGFDSEILDECARWFRIDELDAMRDVPPAAARWLPSILKRASEPEAEPATRAIAFPSAEHPRVSIVIPAHGPAAFTRACLRSLLSTETLTAYEVILVVDGTGVGVGDKPDSFEDIERVERLRHPEALGFVHACNRGAARARGEFIVFLNNDTIVTDGWLDALVETTREFPRAGIVASRLLFPDGRLQESGSIVHRDASAANCGHGLAADLPRYAHARQVDYASAASLLIRRDLFESLGGFDDAFAPAFYEDTDLAFRVREAGYEVWVQPTSSVIHFGGVNYPRDRETGRSPLLDANRDRFAKRWASTLESHFTADVPAARRETRLETGPRVLVVDATTLTPDRDSGSLRMWNLLRVLRRMGACLSYASADRSHPVREVERLAAIGVQVLAPPHVPSIAAYLETHGEGFDLCLVSRPGSWAKTAEMLRRACPRARLVYDSVDLHALRRARELELRGESQVSEEEVRAEARAIATADGVLAVSELEVESILARNPDALCERVTNLHECAPPVAGASERTGMLFVGGFRHAPNVDAVHWFVSKVLPRVRARRPDAVLRIVGSELPDSIEALAGEGVEVCGHVEDLRPLYEASRVAIAPLRYGAGVKGKVNQAMAHGVPCVVTSAAAEGIPTAHEREWLLADEPESFAAAVLRLLDDDALWHALSRAGMEHVEAHFSLQTGEQALRRFFERLGIAI